MAIRIKIETAYAFSFLVSSLFLLGQSFLFLVAEFQLVDRRFKFTDDDDLFVLGFFTLILIYSAFQITQKKLWSYTLNVFIKGIIAILILSGIFWLLDNFS